MPAPLPAEVTLVATDPRAPAARDCLQRYYSELASRFEGGFDVSLSCDPEAGAMVPPRGIFLLAWREGVVAGCVGLKGGPVGAGDGRGRGPAEIKRLWVSPGARGIGLARRLMTAVEDHARQLGIGVLRLDTNSALPEAVRLYRSSGWTEIARFNDDPYPDVFFEKRL